MREPPHQKPPKQKKGSSHQNQTKSRRNPKDPNRNTTKKQEKHPNKGEEGTRSLRHPKALQPNNDPKEQRVCDLRGFLANGLEVGHKTQLRGGHHNRFCETQERASEREHRRSVSAKCAIVWKKTGRVQKHTRRDVQERMHSKCARRGDSSGHGAVFLIHRLRLFSSTELLSFHPLIHPSFSSNDPHSLSIH